MMNGSDKCKHCGADYSLHQSETDFCPAAGFEAAPGRKQRWSYYKKFEPVPVSNGYTEALKKSAQTADLFLQDLQALYPKAQGAAEEVLFYGYIEQVAKIKGTLNRIVAEKTTVK